MSTSDYLETIDTPEIRTFEWNNTTYEVWNNPCDMDDCKKLLTAIVSQAVKDFERLAHPPARTKKSSAQDWASARGFLFDEDYFIDYGGQNLGFSEVLTTIGGFSIRSMRASLIEKTTIYWEVLGVQLPDNFWHKSEDEPTEFV